MTRVGHGSERLILKFELEVLFERISREVEILQSSGQQHSRNGWERCGFRQHFAAGSRLGNFCFLCGIGLSEHLVEHFLAGVPLIGGHAGLETFKQSAIFRVNEDEAGGLIGICEGKELNDCAPERVSDENAGRWDPGRGKQRVKLRRHVLDGFACRGRIRFSEAGAIVGEGACKPAYLGLYAVPSGEILSQSGDKDDYGQFGPGLGDVELESADVNALFRELLSADGGRWCENGAAKQRSRDRRSQTEHDCLHWRLRGESTCGSQSVTRWVACVVSRQRKSVQDQPTRERASVHRKAKGRDRLPAFASVCYELLKILPKLWLTEAERSQPASLWVL